MLYPFIKEIIDHPEDDVARKILADFLEEKVDHAEVSLYARRLREGKINCGLLMDLYSKFGSKWERKMINKQRRQIRRGFGKGLSVMIRKCKGKLNKFIVWESMHAQTRGNSTMDTG
jgi:uncharacterized protein (TIGR02996 family)